jgi:hypothetical protein
MTDSNFIPVTQQQATESKIGNSVKISKQLMKSELKKRIASLTDEHKDATDYYDNLSKGFHKELHSTVERQVHTSLINNSDITRFRNLFAKFSTFNGDDPCLPKFTSNFDMLKDFRIEDITYHLFKKETEEVDEVFSEFLLGRATVNVNFSIPDRFTSDDEDNYASDLETLGYGQPVQISQDLRDKYHLCVEAHTVKLELNSKRHKVKEKLSNIDDVAEEMEAQLLVQELSQTEEGKAALKIAGNLVGDMLGDTPALLSVS